MYFRVLPITIITLILLSCASGSGPISPNLTNAPKTSGSQTNGTSNILWGFYDITINPETNSAEIVPIRIAAFNANVTMFLQKPIAPVNLLGITINPATDFETGYVDCDVTLQHPFKSLAQYRGFDVRGIFMADGTKTVQSVSGLSRADIDEARLLNADGLTRWWNSSEFGPEGSIFGFQIGKLGFNYHPSAKLNGYKYFADGLNKSAGVETLDISTRGTFATNPGANTRNYLIQFPMSGGAPDYHFQYAVDASWDSPDPSYAPDYPIEAFNASAQMQEAYHIILTDDGSTAYYENSSSFGGELKLKIEVFDWQTPSTGPSDELSALYLESPLFTTPIDILPTATESDGSALTSRFYSVTIDDLNLTKSGEEEILVAAISSNGTYEPNIDGGTGGFIFPDEPVVSFAVGKVVISSDSVNHPPVAVADDSWLLSGYAPLTFHMDPTGSYDPDPGDSVVLYEWDIDADGTYEYSNTDGAMLKHVFMDPGTYYVQLRVKDTFGATDLLDAPLEINLIEDPDPWPYAFYDQQNTRYNPNSTLTPPLTLVVDKNIGSSTLSTPIRARGNVYVSTFPGVQNGTIRALDKDTGTEIWNKKVQSQGNWWLGCTPGMWLDNVIEGGTGIWSLNGDVGSENWHVYTTTDFDHMGSVIINDTVYFKSTASIMASVDADTGSQKWTTSWTSHPLFPPVYGEVGGVGYIAAPYSAYLRCVRADNGNLVWNQNVGGNIFTNPVVIGNYVYYGYTTLYKTNLATGSHAATYNLVVGGTELWQPLGMWISNDTLFVSARWYDSATSTYYYKLMAFDFNLNFKWELPILYNCEFGLYSNGYIWLTERISSTNSNFVLRARNASNGSLVWEDTAHPIGDCWAGVILSENRLYTTTNGGRLLGWE